MDLCDFHGVRTFLVQAFGQNYASIVDTGAVSELITESLSEYVGTTVKTDGAESDPYAYATVVPLGMEQPAVAQLKGFLLKTCTEKEVSQKLQVDLGKKGTSLVFVDRFVNLPAELSSPLLKQMLDDLKEAVEEDAVFKTDLVILSTPTYVELESDLDKEARKRAKTAPAAKYYYGEAELLEGLSEYSWDYKVDNPERVSDSKRAFTEHGIEGGRRVFVLPFKAFKRFVGEIDSFIN